MSVQLSNNAFSTLVAGISAVDTSLTVQTGEGDLFPTLAAGEWFPVTVASSSTTFEIMRVTARVGDVFTVTRAQEGTTALAFSTNDTVELRLTALATLAATETAIDEAPAKTTPVNADTLGLIDSAGSNALKKVTWQDLFKSAPLNGTPTAPTAAPGTNTTQVATTAFTIAEILARTKTLVQSPTLVTSSDAAWALQSATRFVLVEVVGGGGAGGGAQPLGATNASSGGGGGAGGYSVGFFDVSAVSTVALTIGAAGTADSSGGNGGNGGASSYSDGTNTVTCPGGYGGFYRPGASYCVPVLGGDVSDAPTGGFINIRGSSGGPGFSMGDVTMGTGRCTAIGGTGGNSKFGSGGRGAQIVGSAGPISISGADGSDAGSGGGGAVRCDDSGFAVGGNGSPGQILVWEYK